MAPRWRHTTKQSDAWRKSSTASSSTMCSENTMRPLTRLQRWCLNGPLYIGTFSQVTSTGPPSTTRKATERTMPRLDPPPPPRPQRSPSLRPWTLSKKSLSSMTSRIGASRTSNTLSTGPSMWIPPRLGDWLAGPQRSSSLTARCTNAAPQEFSCVALPSKRV